MTGHSDFEDLVAAYALDAVEPDEALRFEQHLADCPRCRGDLATYREVASMLGNSGAVAPGQVWERIAAELAFEPTADPVAATRVPAPPPPLPRPVDQVLRSGRAAPALAAPEPGTARRGRLVAGALAGVAAVAAALAAVVGLLSARVSHLDQQVAQMQSSIGTQSVLAEALAASLDPHDTTLHLASASERARLIVDMASGTAWFVGAALAPLPSGRTYQLWSLVRGRPVSVSLLGSRPTATEMHVESGMSVFMVTSEPAGGAVRPSGPIVLQGTLPRTS